MVDKFLKTEKPAPKAKSIPKPKTEEKKK